MTWKLYSKAQHNAAVLLQTKHISKSSGAKTEKTTSLFNTTGTMDGRLLVASPSEKESNALTACRLGKQQCPRQQRTCHRFYQRMEHKATPSHTTYLSWTECQAFDYCLSHICHDALTLSVISSQARSRKMTSHKPHHYLSKPGFNDQLPCHRKSSPQHRQSLSVTPKLTKLCQGLLSHNRHHLLQPDAPVQRHCL